MKKLLTGLLSCLFFLVLVPFTEAALKDRVEETTLANGLKVIFLENHKVPVVTFQVWYRVGSRNEPWGKTGLSHMLEHMMFKGTDRFGPEEFSRRIQESGGNDNAFTSTDYTAYFTNISSDRIGVPLELEADRMQNLVLREEDFQTERMVIMEERRLRTEDNPQAYLQEQVIATAFQIQPYHWPIIGWMEDIRRFTLEDLRTYRRACYNPANAFLVVVGDFRKEDLLPVITNAFGSIPKGAPPDQMKSLEQPQRGERRVEVKKEARLPYLVMGYHVPNLHEPDSYVLEVIAGILGDGKSSRLYQRLVLEERLALSVEADNPLLSKDPGLFFVAVQPLPGKEMAAVEKALNREIERLQTEPVAERELEKAKNQAEAGFTYGQDSLFYQAMVLAQYEINGGWRKIDEYVPSIRKVTAEDILGVAKRYLVPHNRTTGILIPLPLPEGKVPAAGSPFRDSVMR
jgi:zinc protease